MSEDYRVLIVDDDFHIAGLHMSYVDATPGFVALEPVGAGEAALRAVRNLNPDLLLMDVYLPDWNGLDVLTQIDIDAMVLSAANEAEMIRKAARCGALAYLIKPFGAELLQAKLRTYVRYRRALSSVTGLSQTDVERAFRQLHPADHSSKSRSITEQRILRGLLGQGYMSASAVAKVIGVSRATAQRYLSALVDDEVIDVTLSYGGTGRPEHRYALL